jgi:hypothetical protein
MLLLIKSDSRIEWLIHGDEEGLDGVHEVVHHVEVVVCHARWDEYGFVLLGCAEAVFGLVLFLFV